MADGGEVSLPLSEVEQLDCLVRANLAIIDSYTATRDGQGVFCNLFTDPEAAANFLYTGNKPKFSQDSTPSTNSLAKTALVEISVFLSGSPLRCSLTSNQERQVIVWSFVWEGEGKPKELFITEIYENRGSIADCQLLTAFVADRDIYSLNGAHSDTDAEPSGVVSVESLEMPAAIKPLTRTCAYLAFSILKLLPPRR